MKIREIVETSEKGDQMYKKNTLRCWMPVSENYK